VTGVFVGVGDINGVGEGFGGISDINDTTTSSIALCSPR
jgi:hypothetical protein